MRSMELRRRGVVWVTGVVRVSMCKVTTDLRLACHRVIYWRQSLSYFTQSFSIVQRPNATLYWWLHES